MNKIRIVNDNLENLSLNKGINIEYIKKECSKYHGKICHIITISIINKKEENTL